MNRLSSRTIAAHPLRRTTHLPATPRVFHYWAHKPSNNCSKQPPPPKKPTDEQHPLDSWFFTLETSLPHSKFEKLFEKRVKVYEKLLKKQAKDYEKYLGKSAGLPEWAKTLEESAMRWGGWWGVPPAAPREDDGGRMKKVEVVVENEGVNREAEKEKEKEAAVTKMEVQAQEESLRYDPITNRLVPQAEIVATSVEEKGIPKSDAEREIEQSERERADRESDTIAEKDIANEEAPTESFKEWRDRPEQRRHREIIMNLKDGTQKMIRVEENEQGEWIGFDMEIDRDTVPMSEDFQQKSIRENVHEEKGEGEWVGFDGGVGEVVPGGRTGTIEIGGVSPEVPSMEHGDKEGVHQTWVWHDEKDAASTTATAQGELHADNKDIIPEEQIASPETANDIHTANTTSPTLETIPPTASTASPPPPPTPHLLLTISPTTSSPLLTPLLYPATHPSTPPPPLHTLISSLPPSTKQTFLAQLPDLQRRGYALVGGDAETFVFERRAAGEAGEARDAGKGKRGAVGRAARAAGLVGVGVGVGGWVVHEGQKAGVRGL